MGKNWKGKVNNNHNYQSNDFASCRGYGVIIGTCDAAREREANKELLNILSNEIEMNPELYKSQDIDLVKKTNENENNSMSIEDMLKNEINDIQKNTHTLKHFISINTGIKGIVLVKVNHKQICPVMLLKSIFNRIKTNKEQISRHLARVIPLQICFFPTENDLISNINLLIDKEFISYIDKPLPLLYDDIIQKQKVLKRKLVDNNDNIDDNPNKINCNEETMNDNIILETNNTNSIITNDDNIEDRDENTIISNTNHNENDSIINDNNEINDVSKDINTIVSEQQAKDTISNTISSIKTSYLLQFKARNHNVLTKTMALQQLKLNAPLHLKQDYMNAEVNIYIR